MLACSHSTSSRSNVETQVLSRQNDVRRSADQLDELDVARGFAALARERSFVRPLVDER